MRSDERAINASPTSKNSSDGNNGNGSDTMPTSAQAQPMTAVTMRAAADPARGARSANPGLRGCASVAEHPGHCPVGHAKYAFGPGAHHAHQGVKGAVVAQPNTESR